MEDNERVAAEKLGASWVSNGITIITSLIICVVFTIRLEGRAAMNRADIEDNAQAIVKMEQKMDTQYREIMRLLERIYDKLDQKADKETP